jgi:hypothetical protein
VKALLGAVLNGAFSGGLDENCAHFHDTKGGGDVA